MKPDGTLRRTPLFDLHLSLGGRMVPFGGWEMPLQYEGILEESRQVRTNAGLFDVSHMGRFDISGHDATSLLDRVLSCSVDAIRPGRARYTLICNEDGGIIDDCIVYRREESRFLLVPNAANAGKVLDWLHRWSPDPEQVSIEDVTSRIAMIAHQGPGAATMMEAMTPADLTALRPFRTIETDVAGVKTMVARTGYTGEDGFELIMPNEAASEVWKALMDRGASPVGLGARDLLRLEAGLLLHGNDMDDSINPYEAGLDRFVDPDRDGYVAGAALQRIRDRGAERRLVGFSMIGRGIPRHSYAIRVDSHEIGWVASGGPSPTLDRAIGLGYVPTGYSPSGTRFMIDVRGRHVEAEVTALPFYTRRRST